MVTLGFWLRKASVNGMKKQHISDESKSMLVGRGVAFHISPSNVPVNFAYSLFTGLLMGNANIVYCPFQRFAIIISGFCKDIISFLVCVFRVIH